MMKYDRKYVSDEAVEKYDDARFALLMEGYATRLGEDYVEENSRLREDDSFELPSGLDEKCMKAIDGAIARKKRRENIEKAKKAAKRITVAAASFLVVVVLSTVVLYNTVEAFRLSVVDYVIELFEVGEGSIVSVDSNDDKNEQNEVMPTWLPEGYEIVREMNQVNVKMIKYSNGDDTITFTAHSDVNMGSFVVDTENALETFNTKVLEYNGVAVIKAQEVFLYWFEENTTYYIRAGSEDFESIIKMAESCYE
ncbi:MAG: DUF4367 domain-containing protein [Oscillospiraceae bacterium]|nr:DUF4367 domain-containing protein [Oscillospiraceae bacterium]